MPRTESSARPRGRWEPSSSRRSMPPTITMDHPDYGNVTYCADWRDPARLDSLHEVPDEGGGHEEDRHCARCAAGLRFHAARGPRPSVSLPRLHGQDVDKGL